MNTNNILSYMKSRPIRVKVFVPFEFWALGPTSVGLIFSTLVFLVSSGWGILCYTITTVCFLLANSIRNIPAGQVAILIRLNKPIEKVLTKGTPMVIPFITLTNVYNVNFVTKNGTIRDLETKGDGNKWGFEYILMYKVNMDLVYLFEDDVLKTQEQTVLDMINKLLIAASKDIALENSHEEMYEKDPQLVDIKKNQIKEALMKKFQEELKNLCGHGDLYQIQFQIVNPIPDPVYWAKLQQKNQSLMDAQIAIIDKKARITDAEADAEATRIEGKAKAEAQQMLFEAEVKRVEELRKQLGSPQAVADYFKWLNSNLTVEGGGGSGHSPSIIIDPRGGK